MSPALLAALIAQVGIPELAAWLADLRAQNKLVTEEEALAKLNLDVVTGNKIGEAFLASHPKPSP